MNNIRVSLSREHKEFENEVKGIFLDLGLDVDVCSDFVRLSTGDLPMQIMIFLGGSFVGGASWDLLKLGIKKLFNKFNGLKVVLRDKDAIMYSVNINFDVEVVVVPDKKKKFENIKTWVDLIHYLDNE